MTFIARKYFFAYNWKWVLKTCFYGGMLDDIHKRKIDLSDEIFVINVDNYIGDSTRSEIEYALAHGKKVRYLEEQK